MQQQTRLGRLERLDPRIVWQNEATQFTPWLAENLKLLNEALGLETELTVREERVGAFAVEIFGKVVGSAAEVIIENQLGPTDHGHLGQVLTYAAGLDAKIVIWLSPLFRDEHKEALDWLNRHTAEGLIFLGVELGHFRVGDSLPAPNFNVVAEPNESLRPPHRVPTGRRVGYREFFTGLLQRLKERSPGYTTSSRVGFDSWMAFGAGRSGFSFNPAFVSGGVFRVELYIDTGHHDMNKSAFDQLHQDKDDIQRSITTPLT